MVATIKLQIRNETRTVLPAFHLRRARRGELRGGFYRSLISDDFFRISLCCFSCPITYPKTGIIQMAFGDSTWRLGTSARRQWPLTLWFAIPSLQNPTLLQSAFPAQCLRPVARE